MGILSKVFAALGIFLVTIGPCGGAFMYVQQLSGAFDRFRLLGETGDPAVLAGDLSRALHFVAIGIVVGGVGGLLLLMALIFSWIAEAGEAKAEPPLLASRFVPPLPEGH